MQIWLTLPFIYWFPFRSSITNATKCIPELSANGSEAFSQGLYSPMLSGLRPVRLCQSKLPTKLVPELNKIVAANHSPLGWTYIDFIWLPMTYDCNCKSLKYNVNRNCIVIYMFMNLQPGTINSACLYHIYGHIYKYTLWYADKCVLSYKKKYVIQCAFWLRMYV